MTVPWIGEQIGKWLDAASYACLSAGDARLEAKMHRAIERLAASQEADGYLGVTSRFHRNPVRGMQLYEWYYVLHGLLACHELLGSQQALDIAGKLGAYIMKTWGAEPGQFPLVGRYPGNGHDGGEGTLIMEPMVLLGMRLGDKNYIKWCEATLAKWDEWFDRHRESLHTGSLKAMKEVADGRKDIHEIRENIHAHTLHMTLLGLAALYRATGNGEYRSIVLGCMENILEKYVFLTGGMSAAERYVPFGYYNPRHDVEVCPQHTWILLLQQALEWTGEAQWAEELERTLLNNMLAAQLADGSNWSYMVPMNGSAQPPSGPNCCNGAGMRIAGRMPTYIYGLTGSGIAVLQYADSVLQTEAPDGSTVKLTQKTSYPEDGRVNITVDAAEGTEFELKLRIPSFAAGAAVKVNGVCAELPESGAFACIKRRWNPGDTVELEMPMRIRLQAGSRRMAVMRGPLVYAYFHSWQEDPRFHWTERAYPEDIVLVVDPDEPGGIVEAQAPGGCLGPALRVPAVQYRDPIFVHKGANDRIPERTELQALMLPFANQGIRRGNYAVFMSYEKTARPLKHEVGHGLGSSDEVASKASGRSRIRR